MVSGGWMSFNAADYSPKDFKASTDKGKEVFKQSSPYFYINKTTLPMLIFQGIKDLLVPYTQSISFIEKLKEYNIPCQLILKKGAAHGWLYNKADGDAMISWFEKYLSGK